MSDGRQPEPPPAPESAVGDSRRPRASETLGALLSHDLPVRDSDGRLAFGDLVAILGDRAFGALLLVLSLITLVPVPGLSTVTGLPMILIGAQMAAGRNRPWLPRRAADAGIDPAVFHRVFLRAMPTVVWIEHHLRPRFPLLTGLTAERVIGVVVMGLAGILILPIVFGNLPPAVAIAVMALGLIEKDGLFIIAGLVTAVVAVAIVAAVLLGFGEAASFLFRNLFA